MPTAAPPIIIDRIKTDRLLLRAWNPTDAELALEAITVSLEQLRPWITRARHEPVSVDAKAGELRRARALFDEGREFMYGIFDREETKVLGSIGAHHRIGAGACEIGYWIRSDRVREGLATEAAAAVVRISFEIRGLRRIEIHCDPRNLASAGVPRKLGFALQTVIHGCVLSPTLGPREDAIWTLARAAYPASPAAAVNVAAFDGLGRPIHVPAKQADPLAR